MADSEFTLTQAWIRLLLCALVGCAIWFWPHADADQAAVATAHGTAAADAHHDTAADAPPTVAQAWQLTAVFVSVICCFVLRPFPMGVSVILGFVVLVTTKTISIDQALSAYANSTVWLVVAAFFLAGGIVNTGLGRRLALNLVVLLGRSMVGLAYAICGAELILGPVIPSNTVRGGGIMAPIVRALSESLDSHPTQNPEAAGRFLVMVGAQANLITAAMFMTGMAANSIVSEAAGNIGVDFGWTRWAIGSSVPGVVSLLLLPWLIQFLLPTTHQSAQAAQQTAKVELTKIGRITSRELIVAITMVLLVGLWMTKSTHSAASISETQTHRFAALPTHHLSNTLVAWIGICVLLLTRTLSWNDIIGNRGAWDTFIWLGGLLSMANLLRDFGVVGWVADSAGSIVTGLPPTGVVIALALIYYYSMYAFSMLTAHITAMVAAFLLVANAAGGAPELMVALLAYFSCLCASTTNYSTGPVVIYFGLGYVPAPVWFRTGFVVSLFHLSIWLTIGMAWWKLLGWW